MIVLYCCDVCKGSYHSATYGNKNLLRRSEQVTFFDVAVNWNSTSSSIFHLRIIIIISCTYQIVLWMKKFSECCFRFWLVLTTANPLSVGLLAIPVVWCGHLSLLWHLHWFVCKQNSPTPYSTRGCLRYVSVVCNGLCTSLARVPLWHSTTKQHQFSAECSTAMPAQPCPASRKLTDCHEVPLASFDGFRLSITIWPWQLHSMFEEMSCWKQQNSCF